MVWSIVLNGVFIVVMAVGIVVVWRLQHTLSGLYKNRMDMERFVADFSGCISRAQKAIRDLQDTARDAGQDVEGHLVRAQGLRDELNFLVDAADKIASRLSDSASAAQSDAKLARSRVERHLSSALETSFEKQPSVVQGAQKQQDSQPQKTEFTAVSIAKKVETIPAQESARSRTVPPWIKHAEQNAPIINAPVEEAVPVSGLQFGVKKSAQKSVGAKGGAPNENNAERATGKEQPRSLAERELLQALEKMK